MAYAQGGKFWHGAAAGAISSMVGGALGGVHTGDYIADAAIMVAGGGLSGGLSSYAVGGSFWDGLKTGLIVAGLNHAMHMGVKAIETHNLRKNTPLPPALLARLATIYGGALLEPTVFGEVVAVGYTAYLVATYGPEVIQQIIDYMKYPGNDGTVAPEGFEWKGKQGSQPGSKSGSYHNPKTGEALSPDLSHPNPIGPHWDYKDPAGKWWRIYPDGKNVAK